MQESGNWLDLQELATADFPGITGERALNWPKRRRYVCSPKATNQALLWRCAGHFDNAYALTCPPASPQARRTWDDPEETTEDGAVGLAALLAWREIGWPVVLRSWKGSGFDYWLGDRDTGRVSPAERAATAALRSLLRDDNLIVRGRLEVSGIRAGDAAAVSQRGRDKLRQIRQGDAWPLPGFVIILEFSHPLAEVSAV